MLTSPFPSPFLSDPLNPLGGRMQIKKNSEPKAPKDPHAGARYLNYLGGSDGCAAYRRLFLSNHISMTNAGDMCNISKMIWEPNWYKGITCITLQRQASSDHKVFVQFLKSIQSEMGFKMIYEIDDVVFREEIPDYNSSKFAFDSDIIRQNCVDIMLMCDEVTTTNKFIRDLYIEKLNKKEVTAIPNFMPYWWSGHQYDYKSITKNLETHKRKPRIVYSGSAAHFDMKNNNGGVDDFTHVLDFIINNRHKYQFVFIGTYPPPLTKYVISREIEFHSWKTLMEYPTFLASLNAQLFIAPLCDNNFNRAKSDIKFIEACQLGIPCLCQDISTYENVPDFMKFKTGDDLAEKVDFLVNWKNRACYFRLVPDLRKVGITRFLELPENVGSFIESLNTPFGDPSRNFLKRWN